MDDTTRMLYADLVSTDKEKQNASYYGLMEATEKPVDWAYEVWGTLVAYLKHPDNHVRAIAAQVLANLAKSDPDGHIFNDFAALFSMTHDERFVTARHALQAMWKIGVVGEKQRALLLEAFEHRFHDCAAEKNCTLIRYDILQGMRRVFDHTGEQAVRAKALALIDTEPDVKYRKKYASVWKNS